MGIDWDSSSSDAGVCHASSQYHQRLPNPWISGSTPSPPPLDSRVPTTPSVSLPLGIQEPSSFDVDVSFLFLAFVLWIAPCRHVLTTPLQPTGTTTTIGQTRGSQGRLVQRTDWWKLLQTFNVTKSRRLGKMTGHFHYDNRAGNCGACLAANHTESEQPL